MSELTLFIPPGRPWGMPNLSPFCTKLEAYLRMAELPHKLAPANMPKAPKGKIPYVSLDGKLVGDSQLIIEELERRAGAGALDAGLSARDRALGHVMRRMLDEAFYFVLIHLRWIDDQGFQHLIPEFKKVLPGPFKLLMPVIRRSVRKSMRAQGTGRHAGDEVHGFGVADLDALATLLGDQPYLLGDKPRTVDASLFAALEAVLRFPHDSPVKQRALSHANLVAYRDRTRARWWADLDAAAS